MIENIQHHDNFSFMQSFVNKLENYLIKSKRLQGQRFEALYINAYSFLKSLKILSLPTFFSSNILIVGCYINHIHPLSYLYSTKVYLILYK